MTKWEKRVQELEAEDMTRSDAQGCADAEVSMGLLEPEYWTGLRMKMEKADRKEA